MRLVRRMTQIVFIILFFILFLAASYPLNDWIPVDLFLRMDALAMASAGIAERFFLWKFIPALIMLFITIFFGRFFCGWVCPMGCALDGFDAAARTKYGNHDNPKKYRYRWIKYFLLILFLVTSVFSTEIAGWFSPIPLFTRTAVTVLYPLFVFIFFGMFGVFYNITFLEDAMFNLQDSLTGFILPISMTVFRGMILTGLMFIAILSLSFITRRFWCRNLCPLGALLGIFSRLRWYRRRVSDACIECGKCQLLCRMGAIPQDPRKTDHTECINCMDCQAICPTQAISFNLKGKPAIEPVDLSRRRLLGAGLAGLASAGLISIGFSYPVEKGKVIRPPGALDEDRFLDRCIRCGECIRVCSTAGKGLHFTGFESGIGGLGTPRLLTPAGYCEYHCNMCGQVCPTGAIHPLDLEEKHQMKMGTAQFDKTRCIPWYYGETCLVCEEHCPLENKAIKFRESIVTTIDGRKNKVLLPYVDESLCVGCGICASVCPLSADKGIFVTNAGEQRWYS
ncbi:4Fe-4S binding protein [bacterium]|nr:4Fe-4S binding protein [bacterium]